ncbi:Group 1 glycosyl transferase [Flavobacterium anhuiense]|uniref:Group 1 glycosyl transferase n=1 Tax=Flavobacterium anhuiense TaxID=459526 RepID=A0A444VTR9_9FLAO|nr:glycosyltransferase family 1 protein [Flavobacterium anhuiense]RYJ37031.1 Group 1 glycosyl transferase [Flavobacterium anhuiense]
MSFKIFLETHNIINRAAGLGTFNYELVKGLSTLDFENCELTLNSSNPDILRKEFKDKFKYHKYNSLSRHSLFRIRKKYDLWHSVNQNTKVEPFYCNKYLLTVHDVHFVDEISSDPNHRVNKLFKAKLEKSTAITYISEFAKAETHRHFNVPNIPEYVIYNGNPISTILDTSKYITDIPLDKPFFYTIGDFIERKNYESIINMMKLIKDFNLIISGNNNKKYGEEIKKLIADNGLTKQVFLTGKISDEGKQFFMKNCTAFLFPSIREGFGLPSIEAMTFGKPTFLSNKTSLPEIGGNASIYWDNFDPEYMKTILFDGLHEYETNKVEREAIIKKRAADFDWKRTAADYFDVYTKILY